MTLQTSKVEKNLARSLSFFDFSCRPFPVTIKELKFEDLGDQYRRHRLAIIYLDMINLDICPPAAVLIADVAKARRKRARTALLQQHRTIQDLYCKENCTSRSSNFIRRPAAVIQGSDTLFGQTLLTDSPTLALTFSAFTLTLCLPWLINTYRGHQQSDEQQDSEHERKNDGKRASGSGHETADSKSFKGKGENEPQSIAEVWAAAWAPFIVLEGNATDCKGGVEQPIGDDAQAMALSTPLLYIQASPLLHTNENDISAFPPFNQKSQL